MLKLTKGNIVELSIVESAFGGNGIAKIPTDKGDFILFVPNTIKGQKVSARVVKSKKNFAECKLVAIIIPSSDEVEIPYQAISGSPFAKLPIELQKEQKKSQALALYQRIGKVKNLATVFDEYIESPEIWHYRNKMEYSFSAIGYDIEKNE